MKNKNILLIMCVSLAIVLTLQIISSIGITPGRTTLNFEPGLHKEVSFSIINSEHKDMSVVFTVQGNLSESVTLTQAFAEFSSAEESKSFTYTIDLPQSMAKPGLYEVQVVALEMPKDIKEKGTFVGATVSVATQLYIYVPYPNKYLEASVNVVNADGKTTFLVPVVNRGELDIVSARAVIDIYTSLNEKVVTVESNTGSLKSLERKELSAEWTPENVNPGRYLAVVSVIYDNEVAKVEKEFEIGEEFLEILEINIKDFQLGGIAKFDSLVENKWSSGLENVYLNIIVYNEKGEVMADFKSPTYEVGSMEKADMVAYWDTAGVHAGTYDGKIILKYGGKSSERNIQMKITEDSIEVIGLTGHVIVAGKSGFNMNNILIILVVFLVVVNIVWFVVVKRLMKKR